MKNLLLFTSLIIFLSIAFADEDATLNTTITISNSCVKCDVMVFINACAAYDGVNGNQCGYQDTVTTNEYYPPLTYSQSNIDRETLEPGLDITTIGFINIINNCPVLERYNSDAGFYAHYSNVGGTLSFAATVNITDTSITISDCNEYQN